MKRIFLFVLASTTMLVMHAQNERVVYNVSGGLLGAANFSKFKVTDDRAKYDEMKTGWSAGGWINFRVGPGVSIEPQLTYSSQQYLSDDTVSNM